MIMIHEKLDGLITKAMLNHKEVELSVLRSIKAAFSEYTTRKNAQPLNNVVEISIIKKLSNQRLDSHRQYTEAGRHDLATLEYAEYVYLSSFLPKEPTENDIENWLENNNYHSISKKEMSSVMKIIKEEFPSADGKIVSDIVRKHIA